MDENLYIQIKWDLGIHVLRMNKLIEGFRDFEESILSNSFFYSMYIACSLSTLWWVISQDCINLARNLATYTHARLSLPQACFYTYYGNFPEGRNKEGRVATPTSFSIFDAFDMKTLWFEFGHDIPTGFKMPALWIWDIRFSAIL